ncbi:MAG TPA: hypothetical protein VLB80_02370 [Candidatus Babeliales bacterium]|nr:hypothetical protein [Candidatus Babeliales bacterium]
MKNSLIAIIVMSYGSFLYGMEKINPRKIYKVCNTTIILEKGSSQNTIKNKGFGTTVIVGRSEQRTLEEPSLGDSNKVGQMYFLTDKRVYFRNPDDESASDDDNYKPYNNDDTFYKKAQKETVTIEDMSIIEPCIAETLIYDSITHKFTKGFYYTVMRQIGPNSYRDEEHEGDEAIKVAEGDLKMCYMKVLEIALIKGEKENIIVPALSTSVGFPRGKASPVAVSAIIDFIKEYQDPLFTIHLFVKKRSEFEAYQALLTEKIKVMKEQLKNIKIV